MGSAARSLSVGESYSLLSPPPVTCLFETPGSLVSGLRTFDQWHMQQRSDRCASLLLQASIAALHLDQTTENLCPSVRPLKDPEERHSVILKEHPFRAGLSLEQPHSWNDPASARHCHSHQQPVLLSPSRLPLCALMSSGHTPSSSLVLPSVHSAGTSQGVPHIWRGTLAPACLHAPPLIPACLPGCHSWR